MQQTYKGLPIETEYAKPGLYALIRVVPEQGEEHYELREQYLRTNQSLQIRERGWLGSTNGISRHACGVVRLTDKGRIRVEEDTALYQDISE